MSSSRCDQRVVSDRYSAACYICCDVYGAPMRMDRKNLRRHFRSTKHAKNLKASKNQAPKIQLNNNVAIPSGSVRHEEFSLVYSDDLRNYFSNWNSYPADNVETGNPSSTVEPPIPTETCSTSSGGHENLESNPIPNLDNAADLFSEVSMANGRLGRPDQCRDWIEEDSENSDWETETEASDDELGFGTARASRFKRAGQMKGGSAQLSQDNRWFPYPSKAMYLADMLSHSRRTHFGRRHMQAVLEFARETRGKDVPSYKELRRFQEDLKSRVGNPTQRHTSSTGTVYYVNQIAESLKQDMANPHVRPHMTFLPHVDGKRMSQAWHGHKMVHDLPDHFLTPSVHINGRVYYVNEIVKRKSDWFIPLRWVTHGANHEICAVGYVVKESEFGLQVVHDKRITVKATTFLESFGDLQARAAIPKFNDDSKAFESLMPNPLRSVAGSRRIYSIPLIIFMDDASGNVSKQWNKHWSCYLSNAALPREVLQSEYNVRFVTTSTHASPSELMQGVRASIEEAFNNPTVAYDCTTGEEVLIRPFALFWAGDNPMQAEHCSSSGLTSSHFCRTCDVGGSEEFKRSLVGYQTLFKPGNRRVASETRRLVDERLDMATKLRAIQRIKDRARDTGIKDPMAQLVVERLIDLGKSLQKPSGTAPYRSPDEIEGLLRQELASARNVMYMNPLLDMEGVDIHRDTPTEILHTVLLGVVKYYWAQSFYIVEKAKKLPLFESRVTSANTAGLNLPRLDARYMCGHHGSLIGKHFKALVQIMSFVAYDLLPPNVLDAWLLLGRLTSLLWYTEIDDIRVYTDELQGVIDEFLIITAQCSPSILILKPKFHFLVHLPSYIKRFGPALLFSTERFESFNGVFRTASTFSNRHAPSRDIAGQLAEIDRVKHISSGGFWYEGSKWVCATDNLLNFARKNKVFSKMVGIPCNESSEPGSVVPLPKTSRGVLVNNSPRTWANFASNLAVFGPAPPGSIHDQYFRISSITSESGDSAGVGDDILYHGNMFGRINAAFGCVSPSKTYTYYVAVEKYTLGIEKHPVFDMPTASRSGVVVCVPVEEVLCVVNMQHDCAKSQLCCTSKPIFEVQEREQSTKVQIHVQHSDVMHFVINLHGLHNAQRIRRALPVELYTRRAQTLNRQEVFQVAVEKLHQGKQQKVKLAAARREAKAIISRAISEPPEPPDNSQQANDSGSASASAEPSSQGVKRKATGSSTRATKKTRL